MAEELKYCPNCGAEVAATDEFCGKCGFDLKAFRANQTQPKTASVQPTEASENSARLTAAAKTKRTTGRKHRRRWPWILGGIVFLLVVCFIGGSWYYSKSNQANRLATAVTSTDDDDIAAAVLDDDGQKVDDDAVKPLQNLYESDADARDSIKLAVKTMDSSQAPFEMVKDGHYFLFTRYALRAKDFRLTIKTNVKDATVTGTGDSLSAKPVSGGYTVDNLFPGRYNLQIAGNVSGSSQSVTKLLPSIDVYKQLDNTVSLKAKAPQTTAAPAPVTPNKSSDQSSDSSNDSDGSTDYSYDTSLRNDNTDDDILIGDWRSNVGTWEFSDDGTYEGEDTNDNDLSGNWEVVYHKGNYWNIKYDHDDGKIDVEPYRYEHGQLVQCQLKIHWHADD
ncbi:membrane protein [Secundilactobacillus pentosiphilus]|uniref:Membrane protein n=1 Tax=Secundilactobacillus pentosiphilus TaxID=1714682 RepID=A0A1Z5IPI5_9LACO|nr:zinc ribbon domain-containing protein [Secundilactobacillus pentosiphilus]GAX03667.1 membrane protein [Secundilactobacillus pentosiphilus]